VTYIILGNLFSPELFARRTGAFGETHIILEDFFFLLGTLVPLTFPHSSSDDG
jgi:hypothetical protein